MLFNCYHHINTWLISNLHISNTSPLLEERKKMYACMEKWNEITIPRLIFTWEPSSIYIDNDYTHTILSWVIWGCYLETDPDPIAMMVIRVEKFTHKLCRQKTCNIVMHEWPCSASLYLSRWACGWIARLQLPWQLGLGRFRDNTPWWYYRIPPYWTNKGEGFAADLAFGSDWLPRAIASWWKLIWLWMIF